MDFLNSIVDAEQLSPWLMRGVMDRALVEFSWFLLVVIRFSGLMILGPIFGQSLLPLNVRAMLTLSLAVVVTPALSHQQTKSFDRWDLNGDQTLTREELPPEWEWRWQQIQQVTHRDSERGLSRSEFVLWMQPQVPTDLLNYLIVAAGELSLGLLLGLGVMTVLAGLQLAGQIIDQQAGFSLGEIVNPDLDSTGSVTGQALSYLGMTLFVLLEPLGGHLTMLRTLLETFETLPLGEAWVSASATELVGSLVQESLAVGLRVAAPMLVMMTLIDITLGFLGHSVPQVNIQAVGFTTRASLCLVILVVLLTDIPDMIGSTMPPALELLRGALETRPG
ncbi:hypothetical protein GC163_22935 [bacterium]|nr:hypothetical protein [bacterium]